MTNTVIAGPDPSSLRAPTLRHCGPRPFVIAGLTNPVIAGLTNPVIAGLTNPVIAGLTRNLIRADERMLRRRINFQAKALQR